jgi:hypothetical protein
MSKARENPLLGVELRGSEFYCCNDKAFAALAVVLPHLMHDSIRKYCERNQLPCPHEPTLLEQAQDVDERAHTTQDKEERKRLKSQVDWLLQRVRATNGELLAKAQHYHAAAFQTVDEAEQDRLKRHAVWLYVLVKQDAEDCVWHRLCNIGIISCAAGHDGRFLSNCVNREFLDCVAGWALGDYVSRIITTTREVQDNFLAGLLLLCEHGHIVVHESLQQVLNDFISMQHSE